MARGHMAELLEPFALSPHPFPHRKRLGQRAGRPLITVFQVAPALGELIQPLRQEDGNECPVEGSLDLYIFLPLASPALCPDIY